MVTLEDVNDIGLFAMEEMLNNLHEKPICKGRGRNKSCDLSRLYSKAQWVINSR